MNEIVDQIQNELAKAVIKFVSLDTKIITIENLQKEIIDTLCNIISLVSKIDNNSYKKYKLSKENIED